jgi:hypothetical protein
MTKTESDNTNEKLLDLVQEWGQRAVEAISSSELTKEIPFVKTVFAGVAAIVSVRDEILLQKLRMFLAGLSNVPPEQRRAMISRLESDPNYGRKIGEHVVELLDRVDTHRKPTIVGHIFAEYACEKIDVMMLQRLIAAIERLPAFEIDQVRRFVNTINNTPERDRIDPESVQALINSGLTWSTSGPLGGTISYNPNRTCLMFVELNLDVRVEPGQ